jgi:energy-coupling factor transporter ATP-binding protein EcfA2
LEHERQDKLRLTEARVTNFACFRDSGDVPIENVTVLLAENENGKTTFLRALDWFSSDEPFDEDDRWDRADPDAVLDVVSLTFSLTQPARVALQKEGMKPSDTVRITKNTDGQYRVENATSSALLEPSAGEPLFERRRRELEGFIREHGSLAPSQQGTLDELQALDPGSGLLPSFAINVRSNVIPHLPPDVQGQANQLLEELEQAAQNGASTQLSRAYEVLEPHLPRLIYFDDTVDFIEDSVTYAEVAGDPQRHRTMINLASVAGIDLEGLAQQEPHDRQRQSRHVSETLSAKTSKYWQGDPITFHVQLDESRLIVSLEHKGRDQKPSRRSRGLKWQLGFYVNFSAETGGDLAGAILLLDEPGLHLHIKQQPKLLALFDDIARGGNQIVYSTHLSHMLQADKPHRFRPLVVDDKDAGTTKVVPNINSIGSRDDVMKPVREVLGLGIADAIAFGTTTVIGEGLSERYLLLSMSSFCRDARLTALDEKTTVLPAGGSGKKMLPLAALAASEKTKAVVLVDDDKAGRATEKAIVKILPGALQVVRTHEIENGGLEIEDLFDRMYYVELVNDAHRDVANYSLLEESDLDNDKSICDAVDAAFKARNLGEFQKLRPAIELQRRLELGERPDERSLDAFSELFSRLNGALKPRPA